MEHLEKLKKYLDNKLIQYTIDNDSIIIDNKEYSLVGQDEKIFDEDMEFEPTNDKGFDMIYSFSGRWYINEQGESFKVILRNKKRL